MPCCQCSMTSSACFINSYLYFIADGVKHSLMLLYNYSMHWLLQTIMSKLKRWGAQEVTGSWFFFLLAVKNLCCNKSICSKEVGDYTVQIVSLPGLHKNQITSVAAGLLLHWGCRQSSDHIHFDCCKTINLQYTSVTSTPSINYYADSAGCIIVKIIHQTSSRFERLSLLWCLLRCVLNEWPAAQLSEREQNTQWTSCKTRSINAAPWTKLHLASSEWTGVRCTDINSNVSQSRARCCSSAGSFMLGRASQSSSTLQLPVTAVENDVLPLIRKGAFF